MNPLASLGSALGSVVAWPGFESVADALARASIRGTVGVAVAAGIAAGAKRLSPAAKCRLWWFACCVFLVPVLPGIPSELGVPVAIPPPPALDAPWGDRAGGDSPLPAPPRFGSDAVGPASTAGDPDASTPPIAVVLAGVWGAGVLAFATRGFVHAARAHRWASHDVAPLSPQDQELVHVLAARTGLPGSPRVVLSGQAPVPLVVSWGRPGIVLPRTIWTHLDPTERALVLTHEIAHVARRDAAFSWIPWIVECLFWFHPMARHAVAEFSVWREAACDARVLDERTTPSSRYAELLVKLGAGPRLAWAGVGVSSEFRTLKRRILMLDRSNERGGARLVAFAVLLLASIAVVPVRFLESSASAEVGDASAPEAPLPAKSPSAPAPPAPPAPPTSLPIQETAPDAPAPDAPAHRNFSHSTTWSDERDRRGASFLFVEGDNSHMVGSASDARRLNAFRRRTDSERFLLVRDERGTFRIEDDASLAETKALFASVEELGSQQGELGEMQGELGERQGELGDRQGELGALQGELAEKMERLERELERGGRRSDRGETQARVEAREELADRMRELASRQSELGEIQAALGQEQTRLGVLQSELGEKQEHASRVLCERLAVLLDAKIESGVATRVGD